MNVNERRLAILQLIKESTAPINGNQLAQQYDVSRQIIVSDIAQLRAEEYPIKATKQGYIFQKLKNKEKSINVQSPYAIPQSAC